MMAAQQAMTKRSRLRIEKRTATAIISQNGSRWMLKGILAVCQLLSQKRDTALERMIPHVTAIRTAPMREMSLLLTPVKRAARKIGVVAQIAIPPYELMTGAQSSPLPQSRPGL